MTIVLRSINKRCSLTDERYEAFCQQLYHPIPPICRPFSPPPQSTNHANSSLPEGHQHPVSLLLVLGHDEGGGVALQEALDLPIVHAHLRQVGHRGEYEGTDTALGFGAAGGQDAQGPHLSDAAQG